jgi:hypothetical protein
VVLLSIVCCYDVYDSHRNIHFLRRAQARTTAIFLLLKYALRDILGLRLWNHGEWCLHCFIIVVAELCGYIRVLWKDLSEADYMGTVYKNFSVCFCLIGTLCAHGGTEWLLRRSSGNHWLCSVLLAYDLYERQQSMCCGALRIMCDIGMSPPR